MSPLDWFCPLLAIDADAFNHGDTPEFAALSAVALRHNDISNVLTTAPHQFEPMHRQKPMATSLRDPGVRDSTPRCGSGCRRGAVAGRRQRQSRPGSAHPAALSRRSEPSTARTATEGPRDRPLSP
ncbi:hypothetical protein QCM79_42195 [Bradyrhizobium sp. SSUT77]|nr:hypothetical protein [Bradyrhizobium sp. SSUT77]